MSHATTRLEVLCKSIGDRLKFLIESLPASNRFVVLKDKSGDDVFIPKRNRRIGLNDQDKLTELEASAQCLQKHNVVVRNVTLRKLGYGAERVNSFMKQKKRLDSFV